MFDCDWIYNFPKLQILDVNDLRDALDLKKKNNFLEYDPGESFVKELERGKRKEEIDELRESIDKAYQDDIERSKYEPLPKIVHAYKNIYGQLPEGWPHK